MYYTEQELDAMVAEVKKIVGRDESNDKKLKAVD